METTDVETKMCGHICARHSVDSNPGKILAENYVLFEFKFPDKMNRGYCSNSARYLTQVL